MESLGFYKLCKDTPILLRVKGNDTKTFAGLLSSYLGKLGNKSCRGNRLAGTGFTRKDTVHQLAVIDTELKGCLVTGALRPTLAGKDFSDIYLAVLLRRNGKLGNVADVRKDTTFTDSREMRVSTEFFTEQDGGVTVGFHTARNTVLAVIGRKSIKMINQVILLFSRKIHDLQGADS